MIARISLAVAVLLVAAGPAARATEKPTPAGTSESRRPPGEAPAPPDIDLRRLRNIFRYGDEPHVNSGSAPVAARPSAIGTAETLIPESRTRLVGLVERGERRAAALSIDGEVVVLGAGESVAGFTVLVVGDEEVILRGPDGGEETLPLP
ncbi:MAG: hypothetical protein LJF30_20340 [Acidobacteria bacterium]|nr:hypothetical protein [Acidobacteriota bacterium]